MEETEDRKKLGVKKNWTEEETLVTLISYVKNICNYSKKILKRNGMC